MQSAGGQASISERSLGSNVLKRILYSEKKALLYYNLTEAE